MKPINLAEKFGLFTDQWTPKVIGNIDNFQVYLSKLEGDFVWHTHDDSDEFFLVVEGRFRMDFRDKQVWVAKGEVIIVPAGVEHKPFAQEECSVMIVEKSDTDHTGGVEDARRKENHERI